MCACPKSFRETHTPSVLDPGSMHLDSQTSNNRITKRHANLVALLSPKNGKTLATLTSTPSNEYYCTKTTWRWHQRRVRCPRAKKAKNSRRFSADHVRHRKGQKCVNYKLGARRHVMVSPGNQTIKKCYVDHGQSDFSTIITEETLPPNIVSFY